MTESVHAMTLPSDQAERGRRSSGFNPNLHGARGLFCVMVFVFHIANSGMPTFTIVGDDWIGFALRSGQFGVELFFGISGIVIIGAMARAPSLRRFAWDRAVRIYPVLWATVAVILAGMLLRHTGVTGWIVFWSLAVPPPGLFVPLLNPASWSLTFEFALYALVALGWTLRHRRLGGWGAFGGLVAMVVMFPITVLMIPGVLIGLDNRGGRSRVLAWLSPLARFPIVMLSLFLSLWEETKLVTDHEMIQASPFFLGLWQWLAVLPLIAIAAVCGAAALCGITAGHGLLGRVLRSRVMQWLGTISYSFYLWHPVVLGLMRRSAVAEITVHVGDATRIVVGLVGFALSLMVATISHAVIEQWLARRLHRLVSARAARNPAARRDLASNVA